MLVYRASKVAELQCEYTSSLQFSRTGEGGTGLEEERCRKRRVEALEEEKLDAENWKMKK